MPNTLKNGYNVLFNQRVNGTDTPVYLFTKTSNVEDATGKNLDTIIAGLAPKDHGLHVPAISGETQNDLRFLNNDNSWKTLPDASTSGKGVVQLYSGTDLDDATKAATASAVKTVQDNVDAVAADVASVTTDISTNYVANSRVGVATSETGVVGIATLDRSGKVPAAQLPSFVDDVIEVHDMNEAKTSCVDSNGKTVALNADVVPETGKIYLDVETNKSYRWGGTKFGVIASDLALGRTASSAFPGDAGAALEDRATALETAQSNLAATVSAIPIVESSENNGYIKIDGAETAVYVHPSGTNPHGTTAADVGLGNVENKSSETIRSEITSANVVAALGYTPQDQSVVATASNNGVMSAAQAAKLDNTMQMAVSANSPSFSDGIWFQIVQSGDTPETGA